MDVEMLKIRARLEISFNQLVKAIKRKRQKKKKGKNIDILENQIKIVFQKMQKMGGFLTAEEKKRMIKTKNYDEDYSENLLFFKEEKMKEKKGQKIISTDFHCCNCGNKISGQPYIRNGKSYCHLCRDRANLGLFDHMDQEIVPALSYFGVRINGQ